jgi:hypothetical protein
MFRTMLIIGVAGAVTAHTTSAARACSCIDGGAFLKVAPGADLLIQARVIKHTGFRQFPGDPKPVATTMKLEITKVYRGTERRKQITVLGDRGWDCLEYVSRFPVGSAWFFALHRAPGHRIDERGQDQHRYAISTCGTYAVRLKGGKVVGRIERAMTSRSRPEVLSVERFLEFLSRLPRRPAAAR